MLETIASVRAQTHENWEAVCIDDGSSDNTPELLDTLSRSDERIRRTRTAHSGLAAARNHGVQHARAERVFFLDADDLLRPQALALLLRASRELGDNTIVTAGFELLDAAGRALPMARMPGVPRFNVDVFLRSNRLTPMTLVPLRLLGPQPFDEDVPGCEDWDLWLRLANAGAGCFVVPRVLLGYRLSASSMSHQAESMYASGRRVLERWLPQATDAAAVRGRAAPLGLRVRHAGDDGRLPNLRLAFLRRPAAARRDRRVSPGGGKQHPLGLPIRPRRTRPNLAAPRGRMARRNRAVAAQRPTCGVRHEHSRRPNHHCAHAHQTMPPACASSCISDRDFGTSCSTAWERMAYRCWKTCGRTQRRGRTHSPSPTTTPAH